MQSQRILYGPWFKGINRAVSKDKLGLDELYEACGVYMDSRGALNSCFESAADVASFTQVAGWNYGAESAQGIGGKDVPFRVIYWPDDGKIWQLYSSNYTGTSAVRRQDTDRIFATVPATAVAYRGYLILCGDGQQTLAVHASYSADTASVTIAAGGATYSSGTGVVTVSTWSAGTGVNIIVGDILQDGAGNRFAVDSVGSATTFSIAISQTVSFTSASVVERFRPIRLGSEYAEFGAAYSSDDIKNLVTATQGSKTVTFGVGTALPNYVMPSAETRTVAAGQYITFNSAASWGYSTMDHRSYKIASVDSVTQITLEDAYEGATITSKSGRIATTALYVALPFVYGGRLCAVGANSASGGNYSTIYWSGFPGLAANGSAEALESDIFDWMYWDQVNAYYPVGTNEGAIQRVIPQDRRMVPFLQNGIYEIRNTLPVDALLGSDLADNQLAPGLGATTYDSVEETPDKVIYFGSPDGKFRLVGSQVEQIDPKIVDHELYGASAQWVCYYKNAVYFTTGTDDASKVANSTEPTVYRELRMQHAGIFIFDLPTQSWTVTQRLGTIGNRYLYPLYTVGRHGGIFNPYRSDLTEPQKLMVSSLGGLRSMNDESLTSADRERHVETIFPAFHTNNDPALKRTKRAIIETFPYGVGNVTTNTIPVIVGADGREFGNTLVTHKTASPSFAAGETNRYVGAGSGGRGSERISLAVGHFRDYDRSGLDLYKQDASTQASSTPVCGSFTAPVLTNCSSDFNRIDRLDVLMKMTALVTVNPTMNLYSADGVSLGQAAISSTFSTATCPKTSTGYIWVTFTFATGITLTAGTTYYYGFTATTGTILLARQTYTGRNTYTLTGTTFTSVNTDSAPVVRVIHEVGGVMAVDGVVFAAADYLPLSGRKR